MQNRFFRLLTLACTLVLSLGAQFAVDHGPGGGIQNSTDAIARRVEFLTALLTLTTAQASQATTIFTNAAAAVTPLQTSLETAHTSLKAAVQSNNTAQIDQLAAQIGTLSGQVLAARNKAEAAFYALLTAEQRTRYDAAGDRGPGGRGRGPGR